MIMPNGGVDLEARITMRVGNVKILSVSAMGVQVQHIGMDGNPTSPPAWVAVGELFEISGTVEIT